MANVMVHRWLPCAVVGVVFFVDASAGFGQSFLDKLESVVREKLNTPATDAKKSADPKSVGEELPAPNRTKSNKNAGPSGIANDSKPGAPANPSSEKLPSILEGSPLVPPPPGTEGALQLAPSIGTVEGAESAAPAGVYLGLEVEELVGGGIGVRVSGLSENSPAWKAGFKVGDLLQAIDGHAIADINGMADRLRRVVPGKPTKFLVKRGGRNMELVAVLQNAALANRLGASTGQIEGQATGPAFLGILASDLTPAFRTQFGLAVYSGAAVTNVAQGSPAHRAGIQPGDAVVEINGAPINGGEDLMRWIAGAQIGQPAELTYFRGTQPSTVSVVLSGEITKAQTNKAQTNKAQTNDRSRVASRPPVGGPVPRPNTSLQVEVEQLRVELEQTQQQLLQTQKRLEQVLQQLEQNR